MKTSDIKIGQEYAVGKRNRIGSHGRAKVLEVNVRTTGYRAKKNMVRLVALDRVTGEVRRKADGEPWEYLERPHEVRMLWSEYVPMLADYEKRRKQAAIVRQEQHEESQRKRKMTEELRDRFKEAGLYLGLDWSSGNAIIDPFLLDELLVEADFHAVLGRLKDKEALSKVKIKVPKDLG